MSLSRALDLLSCPRCGSAVTLGSGTVVCRDGHTWDVARQGYVNLLGRAEPANADTTAMLAARSRVLAAGLFDPVAAAIRAALTGRPRVLEVGSGTAYYLVRALGDDDSGVGIALDVSKAAARLAAKADPRVAAVVADVWRRLPIQDHSLDAVLCVFAPRNIAEFARVLRPDGRLVVATPNPEHLSGLRSRHDLLRVPPEKVAQVTAAAAEFFEPIATTNLLHRREVDAALAWDLIAMGPNAFHGLPEGVQAAHVEIAVNVTTFAPLSS